MRILLARVGRLQRLAVFEAAARLGSFTAAAAELGMTQPAVTRQVRALEESLGLVLFHRGANRARVSDPGRELLHALTQGVGMVEATLERLGAAGTVFVLAANPGVAQRWLVPYLDGLQAAVGELDLRLWLFDRDAELARGRFDAAIHVGRGDWPGLHCQRLFPEQVLPVTAPALATQLGLDARSEAAALPAERLLHLDEQDRPWMSWRSWHELQGLPVPRRGGTVIFNNYALVLHEAMAGHGIALGWRHLVDDFLQRELLVAVGPEVRHPHSGYYLIWRDTARNDVVRRIAGWLQTLIAGG